MMVVVSLNEGRRDLTGSSYFCENRILIFKKSECDSRSFLYFKLMNWVLSLTKPKRGKNEHEYLLRG